MEYLMVFFSLIVIGAFAIYLLKKTMNRPSGTCAMLVPTIKDAVEITKNAIELTQEVIEFRMFLLELGERVARGEVSTKKARELVFKKKAATLDRVYRLIILAAKNAQKTSATFA